MQKGDELYGSTVSYDRRERLCHGSGSLTQLFEFSLYLIHSLCCNDLVLYSLVLSLLLFMLLSLFVISGLCCFIRSLCALVYISVCVVVCLSLPRTLMFPHSPPCVSFLVSPVCHLHLCPFYSQPQGQATCLCVSVCFLFSFDSLASCVWCVQFCFLPISSCLICSCCVPCVSTSLVTLLCIC